MTWYGGCHYSRDKERGLLTISQQAFRERLVEKYSHGSSTSIPASPGVKLEGFEGGWPFREVVGSLMWLANQTRPDIANAVRAVARYCHVPTSVHWKAVLHIVRYLKSTSQLDITFQRGSGLQLEVFADSDFASKAKDRKCISGGAVMCGRPAVS